MASAIDICNLGLSNLGDEANIASFTEGSAQAEHCKRFYPIARDAVLEKHTWNCATRRVALALLAVTPPASWLYVYQRPTTALRVIAVLPEGVSEDSDSEDFTQEILADGTQVIYTNTENATVRYIALVTDTTKYAPWMVIAIARLLSSFLAGPIVKGETGMKVAAEHLKIFNSVDLPNATSLDATATQNEPYRNMTPAGISARR